MSVLGHDLTNATRKLLDQQLMAESVWKRIFVVHFTSTGDGPVECDEWQLPDDFGDA